MDTHNKDRQAGIEVTDAMLESGFRLLVASGIADDYLEADKLLLADIYRAMQEVHLLAQSVQNQSNLMTD